MNTWSKWDFRFIDLARVVSTWSRDPSTKTGAVIVRPDKTVCSMGFNGFPRKMFDEETYYQNREEKYSRIVHCEMNALLFAREPVIGYTLYTYPFISCDRCFVHMAQAGIRRCVAPRATPEQEERWGDSFKKTLLYAAETGITVDFLWPHEETS